MEQQHDEHIECADCGAPFVFSAAEAAVFAERALAAPKRCKDCRRARKERAANDGARSGQRPQREGLTTGARPAGFRAPGASQGPYGGGRPHGNGQGGAGRWSGRDTRAPRYTGDVNEYRSPMQDGFSATPYATAPRATPRFAPAQAQGSGEYRSPMSGGFAPGNHRAPLPGRPASGRSAGGAGPRREGGARPPRAAFGGGGTLDSARAPRHDGARDGGSATNPQRRRPQGEMFAITCDTCGAQAEVPFKPAEGREVYCPTCYRARRPAP